MTTRQPGIQQSGTQHTRTPPADGTHRHKNWFHTFSAKMAHAAGKPMAFIGAVILILVWAATGPIFGYSDTWQLVINTGTTIITFLMVFLIQNTQNRDAKGMQLKLDELIKSAKGARNLLLDVEDMDDDELQRLEDEFKKLREKRVTGRGRSAHRASRPSTSGEPPR